MILSSKQNDAYIYAEFFFYFFIIRKAIYLQACQKNIRKIEDLTLESDYFKSKYNSNLIFILFKCEKIKYYEKKITWKHKT